MKLNAAEVREAVRTLQTNKARPITRRVDVNANYGTVGMRPSYVGIITPAALFDLKSDSAFVPTSKYPSQADIMEGEVGSIDDVRFVMSTNAKVYTGAGASSADVHIAMILAQDFYGITRISGKALVNIVKPLGSSGTADPLNQRSTSGWKATFVAKRLNEAFAVRIEHGVTP